MAIDLRFILKHNTFILKMKYKTHYNSYVFVAWI